MPKNEKARADQTAMSALDKDLAYRDYVADLILSYITEQRTIGVTEAFRRVTIVTERTLSTVKNWLSTRSTFPDVASLARIVKHWNIPPEAIFRHSLPWQHPPVRWKLTKRYQAATRLTSQPAIS